MSRLLPPLWYRHRGFATVALGITVWHLIAGVDGWLGPVRHSAPIWEPMKALAPMPFWGTLHFLCALGIIYGVYKDNPDLHVARACFIASISLFSFTDLAFGLAAYNHANVSIYVLGGNVLAVMCSIAAALEPPIQTSTSLITPREPHDVAS